MSKSMVLSGLAALGLFIGTGAALGQPSPDQTEPTMSVYLGNLADFADRGNPESVVQVPLAVAAEACGVDLKFIEAWAVSEPRYCVALHHVEALDAAIEEQLGGGA